MKLQIAMEYILIVGLVLIFLTPLWIYTQSMKSSMSLDIYASYAKNAADKIAEAANFVYYQGKGSKISIDIYIPPYVNNTVIANNTVIIRLARGKQIMDLSSISNAEINGTIPLTEGKYIIGLESMGDYVQIYD